MSGQKFVYRAFQEHLPTAKHDLECMQLALSQAQVANALGEVPIGAVLCHRGDVLAQAHNQTLTTHNPCGHAEIVAIQAACAAVGNARLGSEAVLYVTLTPCLMCLGAIFHARIGRVVVGCAQSRFADHLPTVLALFERSSAWHPCVFEHGCMAEFSVELLQRFFVQRRRSREALLLNLKSLAHLPNVNGHTVSLLNAQGFYCGPDLLEPTLADAMVRLTVLAQQCQEHGDNQQAAVLTSLVSFLQGGPAQPWRVFMPDCCHLHLDGADPAKDNS